MACPRLHFQKLMFDWTDPSLGNCSYLDTCRNMRTCRHIHYKLDTTADVVRAYSLPSSSSPRRCASRLARAASPRWRRHPAARWR